MATLQPIPFGSKPIAPIPFGSKPIAPVATPPAAAQAPGLNVGGVLKDTGTQLQGQIESRADTAYSALTDKNSNPLEKGLRVFGQGLGAANDIVGGAVSAAGNLANNATGGKLGDLAKQAAATPLGQMGLAAIRGGQGKVDEFAQKYPRAAADLQPLIEAANLAFNLTGIGATKEAVEVGAKAGAKAAEAGSVAVAKAADKAVPVVQKAADKVVEAVNNKTTPTFQDAYKAHAEGNKTLSQALDAHTIVKDGKTTTPIDTLETYKATPKVSSTNKGSNVLDTKALQEEAITKSKDASKQADEIVSTIKTPFYKTTLMNDSLKAAGRDTELTRTASVPSVKKQIASIFDDYGIKTSKIPAIKLNELRKGANQASQAYYAAKKVASSAGTIPKEVADRAQAFAIIGDTMRSALINAEKLTTKEPQLENAFTTQRIHNAALQYSKAAHFSPIGLNGVSRTAVDAVGGAAGSVAGGLIGQPIAGAIAGAGLTEAGQKAILKRIYEGARKAKAEVPKAEGGVPKRPFKPLNRGFIKIAPDAPKAEKFEGFTDLSTKLLGKLEGRVSVSKQFIEDATNAADLKQPEKDLFRNLLGDVKGTVVNVKDFANKVKSELLPLKRGTGGNQHESITLPEELRGPVSDYSDHIYSSPIKTSAGNVHFESRMGEDEVADGAENYFAHTRVEDLPDDSVRDRIMPGKLANTNPEFNKRYPGDTRRVIELQSDLFQKGRLEREAEANKSMTPSHPASVEQDRAIAAAYADDSLTQEQRQLAIKKAQDEFKKAADIENAPKMAQRAAEIAKLEPYRNTWQDRIVREEVKQAAVDGKTKLQFPTGETAMKVEGLVNREDKWVTLDNKPIAADGKNIKEGDLITYQTHEGTPHEDRRFLITKNNGNGTFEAVDSLTAENDHTLYKLLERKDLLDDGRIPSLEELHSTGGLDGEIMAHLESISEQLSAKDTVDKDNPIYKFYEKEVGRYLRNKYKATLVTDPQGVTWYEVDVPKDAAKNPVEAYGIAAGGAGVGAASQNQQK